MSDTSICKVYVIKFVVSQFPKITHPHPKLALGIFLTIFFLGVFLVIFFFGFLQKNTAPSPSLGIVGGQAVALRIAGDRAAFYGYGFYGAPDTFYEDRGRHYFR